MELCSTYRSQIDSPSDSDSDGSEKECAVWKRATKKPSSSSERDPGFNPRDSHAKEVREEQKRSVESSSSASQKRKRNNIWSEVLEDQMMSETLTHCGLRNKPKHYDARGEESYDYTLKYEDPRNAKDFESRMSTSESSCDDSNASSNPKRHRHKRFKRMEVENDNSVDRSESGFFSKKNLLQTKDFEMLSKEEIETGRKIIKILNEKKHYIIYRVVKFTGIDKALQLLKMTEQIEESGGMMIMNQARRRTPGGVYFQLLKSDKDITQEMQDKIFEGEMSPTELKQHYAEIKKRKAEAKKLLKKKKALEKAIPPAGSGEKGGEPESVGMEVAEEPNGKSNEDDVRAPEVEDGEITD